MCIRDRDKDVDLDTQLIPKNVSLEVRDFKAFIAERKKLLKSRLLSIVGNAEK